MKVGYGNNSITNEGWFRPGVSKLCPTSQFWSTACLSVHKLRMVGKIKSLFHEIQMAVSTQLYWNKAMLIG